MFVLCGDLRSYSNFAFEVMFVSASAVLLTALLPAALAFSPSFPYGTEKVRGVSIGGWLVLEVRISNFVSVCIGIDADADAPRLVTGMCSRGSPRAYSTIPATPILSTSGRLGNCKTELQRSGLSRPIGTIG